MRSERALAEVFETDEAIENERSFAVVGNPFGRDVFDIKRANALIVNLLPAERHNLPSTGTKVEMGIAYALGKFIIVITSEGEKAHPFISGPADYVVSSLEQALGVLQTTRPIAAGRLEPMNQIFAEFQNAKLMPVQLMEGAPVVQP